MEDVATSIADYSRPASLTAELVDVGAGETPADYAGKDVRGKIVLAFGTPALVTEQAVWKRGASGILSWAFVAAESARRSRGPGCLALRPREGRPERREDDFRDRAFRARRQVALRRRKAVVGEDGKIRVVGSLGNPDELLKAVQPGQWNQYIVTAKAGHIILKINDVIMCELDDNDPKRIVQGKLALQVHEGPPMLVQFKDIYLREL